MSKNCEVKLVDVFTVKRRSRINKGKEFNNTYTSHQLKFNKRDATFENVKDSSNEKLHKYEDITKHIDNVGEKATRTSKRLKKDSSFFQDSQNKKLNSSTNVMDEPYKVLKNEKNAKTIENILQSVLPEKVITKKRKSSFSDIENLTMNTKINGKHTTATSTASKIKITSVNQEIKQKKRAGRKGNSFWENKLTGARRVSKRLKNQKIKNKTLNNVEVQIERHYHITMKNKERIKNKMEKKRKTTKIKYKYRKSTKPESNMHVLYNVSTKEEANYGKLNHTKKFHPQIATIKETSNIFSENLKTKTGKTEQLNLHDLDFDTVNECSSIAEDKITNDITNNVTDAQFLTEKLTNSEVDSKEQHAATAKQQYLVTLNTDQLNKESDVILQSQHEEECSQSHPGNADENIEHPVNKPEEPVNCSEVIIIDIKSDENVLSEHLEECELFTKNFNPEGQIKESIIERTSPSEKVGSLPILEVMSSKNSEPSDEISYEADSKRAKIDNSNSDDSISRPDNISLPANNIQNEHVSIGDCESICTVDESMSKQIVT